MDLLTATGPPDVDTPTANRLLGRPVATRPQAQQIWRLECSRAAAPVVLLGVSPQGDELLVAAIGEDPEFADSATVIVSGDSTPLGLDFGVWVALEYRIPSFAASQFLGRLPDRHWARVRSIGQAMRSGAALEGDGSAITGALDPRVEYRSALETSLCDVAQAAWTTPGARAASQN